jgi:poly(3-hydroxyalkanoate) depolymerase
MVRSPSIKAASVATEMITVGDQRIRVAVREGDGTQPPLVLMNGLGVSFEGLQQFVDALDPSTGVIRFDVPGVGGSPTPSAPYRFWGMSRLVSRMLDTLGHPQVDVLGVSWGGALAQQFAFQDRGRCRRLVLVSTSSGVTIPGSLSIVTELFSRKRFVDPEHARKVGPRIYGGKLRSDAGATVRILQHVRPDLRGQIFQQLAVLGWTSLPFARLIRQPTLILTGDDDPIIAPVNARILHAVLPNAKLHMFHDGHLGLLTSAAELAPIVEDFLYGRRVDSLSAHPAPEPTIASATA